MASPNQITTSQLFRLIGTPDCPILIDVCIDDDFNEDPRLIPSSRRHPFPRITELLKELYGQRVVIICQKGKKLSSGAIFGFITDLMAKRGVSQCSLIALALTTLGFRDRHRHYHYLQGQEAHLLPHQSPEL